jgi:transposase
MAYGYSIDLRERVLESLSSGMSKMLVHRTFGVSRPTIDRWLVLLEVSGSLSPCVPRHSRVRRLEGAAFEEFAHRHRDSTLDEMARAWHQETGELLSAMSFSRALRSLGWTRKKRVGATRSATKRRAPRS